MGRNLSILLLFFIMWKHETLWSKNSTSQHSCLNGKNPICQDLMTLKPALGYDKALILSHVFHRVARKHHLDPRMLVAIAYQESAFNLSAIRKVSGFDMDRDRNYAEVTVGSDFCMMQINSANIRHYGFDIERLLTDAEYCITAGATILNGFKKRFGQLEEFWWTRYNACSTAHRELYRKLVDRHWGKILPPPERTCSSEFAGDRFMDDL